MEQGRGNFLGSHTGSWMSAPIPGHWDHRVAGLREKPVLSSLHFLPAAFPQFPSDGIGSLSMACYEGYMGSPTSPWECLSPRQLFMYCCCPAQNSRLILGVCWDQSVVGSLSYQAVDRCLRACQPSFAPWAQPWFPFF